MIFGKKLYHSTSITSVKIMALMIIAVLFLNLFFQTLGQEHFLIFLENLNLSLKDASFIHVFDYNWNYPEELILYLVTILIPAIYYGFIRGVSFYEKGIVVNKGLPFFISRISFEDIESFQIIHPKHLVSITLKESEDEMLFTVRDMNRVLAILDQNGISGKLSNRELASHRAPMKLVVFFLIVAICIAFIQYSAVLREIFR